MKIISESRIHLDLHDPSGRRCIHLANGEVWQEAECYSRTIFVCGSSARVVVFKRKHYLDVLGEEQLVRVRRDRRSRKPTATIDIFRQFKVRKKKSTRKREYKHIGFGAAFQRLIDCLQPDDR